MRLPRKVTVCGLEYQVVRVRSGEEPSDWVEGQEGAFDAEKAMIWVKACPGNPSREFDTLMHEIQHVCLDASGAGRFIRKGREEDFVHVYTPALIAAQRSAGLLRK